MFHFTFSNCLTQWSGQCILFLKLFITKLLILAVMIKEITLNSKTMCCSFSTIFYSLLTTFLYGVSIGLTLLVIAISYYSTKPLVWLLFLLVNYWFFPLQRYFPQFLLFISLWHSASTEFICLIFCMLNLNLYCSIVLFPHLWNEFIGVDSHFHYNTLQGYHPFKN